MGVSTKGIEVSDVEYFKDDGKLERNKKKKKSENTITNILD